MDVIFAMVVGCEMRRSNSHATDAGTIKAGSDYDGINSREPYVSSAHLVRFQAPYWTVGSSVTNFLIAEDIYSSSDQLSGSFYW